MVQKTFAGMPKRPHPVFEDVIDEVAAFIAREMEVGECLNVSEESARREIAQVLTEVAAIELSIRSIRNRASIAVRYIQCIAHGHVGHYEITEYFIRVIEDELSKKSGYIRSENDVN